MPKKVLLSDDERKARRLESARKYREANLGKARESARLSQAKRRQDPEVRERDKLYKQDPAYIERQRLYRQENSERLSAKTMEWQAANAEKFKAYQAAYQAANRKRGIQRAIAWRQANKAHASAMARRWRTANLHRRVVSEQRRRARIKGVGGDLSPGIHSKLMALQQGKCAVCGVCLQTVRPHLDHIMPISKGGQNIDTNVQLLCPTCNLSKHAKHPIDFMQERGFLC